MRACALRALAEIIHRLGNMSVVASVISQLSYRVDALHVKVAQLDSSAHDATNSAAVSQEQSAKPDSRDMSVDYAAKDDLESAVAELRGLIDEVKGQQATSLRKERGVIEAVLTQKLDKRVADKVHDAVAESKPTNPVPSKADVDTLVDRLSRVSAEVDRQARFLGTLDAKVREIVASAVREALKDQPSVSAVPADPADIELEDAPSLDTPRLDTTTSEDATEKIDGEPTNNDSDEIDMVKAGDDESNSGKAKKGRAPPRKKK